MVWTAESAIFLVFWLFLNQLSKVFAELCWFSSGILIRDLRAQLFWGEKEVLVITFARKK